jgi:uncharacterized membrane protein
MNPPEQRAPQSTPTISAEAIIGIGITVAWLGILCLMLGWAQWLRHVPAAAWIFLPLGAVLLVVGALGAMMGNSRKKR